MLRQIFILKKQQIIYKTTFGNAISDQETEKISFEIYNDAKKKLKKNVGNYILFNYQISYEIELNKELCFIFVTELIDNYQRNIKPQLIIFKYEFLNLFYIGVNNFQVNPAQILKLNSIADRIHRLLRTKIAIVGFSRVGKTTIKQLIKADEIPIKYVPTISGDIVTIKIGELLFSLWDFAGQEQYRYLWKNYIKGSDAVLIITDSSPKNLKESKFFLELIKKEVPYSRSAIIGNKQDLKSALNPVEIEKIMGIKTYPMIANKPENRDKMINIIADIFKLDHKGKPLVESFIERSQILKGKIIRKKEEIFEEDAIFIDKPEIIDISSNKLEGYKTKTFMDTLVRELQLIDKDNLIKENELNKEKNVYIKKPEDMINSSNIDDTNKVDISKNKLMKITQLIEETMERKEEESFTEKKVQISEPEAVIDSSNKVDNYYVEKRKLLKDEINDLIHRDWILKFIKGKKKIQINYLVRALKIKKEKVLNYIFDLIKNGYIECEFNETNTEFYLLS
ncbi:MAG: GTP-binding protein [Candidatus Lokiarchaeota archaeon]|nr:GTP-binding protein [Candidatus Lokiarchaeota archaeon]